MNEQKKSVAKKELFLGYVPFGSNVLFWRYQAINSQSSRKTSEHAGPAAGLEKWEGVVTRRRTSLTGHITRPLYNLARTGHPISDCNRS